jgi:benzodiazapine receptor
LFMLSVTNLGLPFMDTSSEWFKALVKPAWQPPDIVFPIAWTAINAAVAVSMSLIYLDENVHKRTLVFYALTGILNVLWIYVFFCRHNTGGAFFLLIAIAVTAALLYSDSYLTNKKAAYLLIPLLAFICYAIYLNYEIAFLN